MQARLHKPNFHGFMVDATSVNYDAIPNIYGSDPNVPSKGKEHRCFYH
jgi:hypothetical protein